MVRESLFAALRRLRHKTIELVLWIDAICINQDDMVEKAQQIRLLPRIYQNASCTLAFLGAEDTTNDAVKVLLQVQAVKLCGQDSEDIPKELRPIPAAWGANGIPALNDHIWADVAKFFRNPWFRRAWIVQEAVLAPTLKIVSGKWMIDWDDLTGSMEVIDYKLQATHIDTKSWAPFLTLMKAREREVDARHGRLYLFDLLESFRHLDSTLKRDRYFAFLGIAEDGNKVDFDPDYDMPLESITKRIARGILQDLVAEKQGMKMLCRAGLSLQADRFPSWAPNWTVSSPKSLSDSEDRGVTFCSSGTRDERIDLSAGGDTIDIEGYFVDTVNQVNQLRRYFKEIEKMLDSVPEGKIAINTKWKVPIAAALHLTYASSTDTDIESSYNALQKMLTQANHGKEIMKEYFRNLSSESMTPSPFENEGTNLCAKSKNYTSLLGGAVAGWRFITTQRGLCGIASNLVRAGDRVCVFSGGSVPFIVRVSDTRDGMFRLVGESYVDGIMYGEALGFSDVTASMISLH
ncbi:Ubiquitin-like protein [Clarireedia jacksonii]